MVRVALGGKGSAVRKMGVRIHSEMGEAGEAIWVELTGGEWIGGRRYASWKGSPPVDVVDHRYNIGYQVKTVSGPSGGEISFSGAHKQVVGPGPGGKGHIYFGTEEDKLVRIREWLKNHGWRGWKIVMLVDEDTGRVTVYSKEGVTNVGIREMNPIAGFDSETGEWKRIPGTPDDEYPPGIPDHAFLVSGFPRVPEFLRSGGSDVEAQKRIAQMGMFRRVHVRGHRRRA